MKNTITVIISLIFSYSSAQPNCSVYAEESGERNACQLSHKAVEYQQGSKESQILFDKAIAIGPKFAWAYYQKSVPYLKRGFIIEGLKTLDVAVELDPVEYLCYRAYWYWQYRNYRLCIKDLETYYQLPKAYNQTTPGGEKDMRIILGLAYAKIGDFKKGIAIIENCLNTYKREIDIGYSDYLSLGMLYYFNKQYNKSIEALNTQVKIIQESAETYYFLGLSHKELSNYDMAKTYLQKALETYTKRNRFRDINGGFKIDITDVEKQLSYLNKRD